MKFTQYATNFKALQAFVFGWPIVSLWFPGSGIAFPPMGDYPAPWHYFAAIIVGSFAVLPYISRPRRLKRWIIVCAVGCVVFSASYLVLQQMYVVPITHANGAVSYVIRGSVRNPRLKEPYMSMSDAELIRNTGQSDARLEQAYARRSLKTNRLVLFAVYLASLSFVGLTLGLMARFR